MKLYEMAVKKPVIILIGLITLMTVGVISAYKLPIEFLPRTEFPFIGVYVPYPNSHPEYIERNIAKPIEEIMATLGDVREIFSQSSDDGCFVGVEFNWGRDVGVLRMEVKEKLDQIRPDLPNDIEHTQLFTFDTNDIPILEGRISATGGDLSTSYDLIERSIINPLKRIEGVGAVNIDGVQPKEIAIYLRIDKLKAHNIDVGALFTQLQGANMSASGGEITADGLRYSIRSVGHFDDFEEIQNLVVNSEGIRLKDIAYIYYGEPTVAYGRFLDGEKAVAFWLQKASNANTVEVARRVQKAMAKMNTDPALEGINVLLFFDQSQEILKGVRGLRQAGLVGGVFAVLVLYFFIRRMATTLIVAIAIPFSIICTLAFLYFTGRTLNMLTMMGLMLGVGMLVDNAIVVLESIFRHQARGEKSHVASIVGTQEVATAVTAATFTSIIVFAPIVFGSGSDELFVWLSSVGITISVAILFSLLISLTLIPFLTSRLLKPKEVKESRILVWMQDRYVRTMEWTAFKRPFVTLGIVTLMFVGSIFLFQQLKGPEDDDSMLIERIYFSYDFSDNLGYKQTREYVKKAEKAIFDHEEDLDTRMVYSYYRDNFAATTVYFNDKYLSKDQLKEKRKQLREIIPEMAGVTLRMGDESGNSSGGATRLQVSLFGEDRQVLEEISNEVKRRFEYIEGLTDVKTSIETGREQIQIALDQDLASRYSLTSQDIANVLNLTFRGMQLNRYQAADREVPMSISLDPDDKVGVYNLNNLLVGMRDDQDITLGTIADFQETRGPDRIVRENQMTTVSVEGMYEGDEFDDARSEVTSLMNNLELPMGYYWSYSREMQNRDAQKSQMGINALLAVLCVYMLMAALFESFLHPLIIMICLPLAFVGVATALFVSHTAFGIMAMIGVVILIGVVVNNGIVLVDHINNFRKQGLSMRDAVLAGGRERFRPIVMTAATTVLGLLPMALGNTALGDAQYYPLARAVMGGLISSTFLTLLVLPTGYVLAERFQHWMARVWTQSTGRGRESRAAAEARSGGPM